MHIFLMPLFRSAAVQLYREIALDTGRQHQIRAQMGAILSLPEIPNTEPPDPQRQDSGTAMHIVPAFRHPVGNALLADADHFA